MKNRLIPLPALALISISANAGVDKVYSPLVELGELELEMRGNYVLDDDDDRNGAQKTKLAIGYGITSRIFIEGYLDFEKPGNGSYELEAYEVEAKFQLSEQGQYFVDLGLLTELEKVREADEWEFKVGPLFQKPFGNWMATANVLVETKFGSDVVEKNEWELLGRAQLRYLSSPRFEPGVEYYGDEGTQALGPAVYGLINFENSKVKWQAGWMIGLDSATDDHTIRWQFEWEF